MVNMIGRGQTESLVASHDAPTGCGHLFCTGLSSQLLKMCFQSADEYDKSYLRADQNLGAIGSHDGVPNQSNDRPDVEVRVEALNHHVDEFHLGTGVCRSRNWAGVGPIDFALPFANILVVLHMRATA
jgi:hypothetical protein